MAAQRGFRRPGQPVRVSGKASGIAIIKSESPERLSSNEGCESDKRLNQQLFLTLRIQSSLKSNDYVTVFTGQHTGNPDFSDSPFARTDLLHPAVITRI